MRLATIPVLFLLVLALPAPILGDADPRIDPFGGIRWNDRIQDVAARMGALSEGRKAEVSLAFPDRITQVPFGARAVSPGNETELEDSISAIARDYLEGMDASRKRGDDRAYRAFHLHVLGMLFDKNGKRHAFLDAEIRVTVPQVMIEGVPFEMTATFRSNPGAGLTERFIIPVGNTKYLLPVVMTRVALVAKSATARDGYPAIDAALRKRYGGFGKCTVEGAPALCDARPTSVAWGIDGNGTVTIRYDAEKYWTDGLETLYKDHLATVEGRSKRCHAKRGIDA